MPKKYVVSKGGANVRQIRRAHTLHLVHDQLSSSSIEPRDDQAAALTMLGGLHDAFSQERIALYQRTRDQFLEHPGLFCELLRHRHEQSMVIEYLRQMVIWRLDAHEAISLSHISIGPQKTETRYPGTSLS